MPQERSAMQFLVGEEVWMSSEIACDPGRTRKVERVNFLLYDYFTAWMFQ